MEKQINSTEINVKVSKIPVTNKTLLLVLKQYLKECSIYKQYILKYNRL